MNIQQHTLLIAFFAVLAPVADAFAAPKVVAAGTMLRSVELQPLRMLPDLLTPSLLLSDDAEAMAALGPLRTFFGAITALVFFAAGLTYVTAAFIVPAAAEQLEKDTKRLRPGLWEEYEARLEEGEMIASRPDLLQELGDVMQPIILADFEDSAKAKQEKGGDE